MSDIAINRDLLQLAHDILDQMNADDGGDRCNYCGLVGVTGDGIKHAVDCVLPQLRALLNPPPSQYVLKDSIRTVSYATQRMPVALAERGWRIL